MPYAAELTRAGPVPAPWPRTAATVRPRHVDFDQRGRWTYVRTRARERAPGVHAPRRRARGHTAIQPRHAAIAVPAVRGQVAGPIHVSEGGRHVYLANRADATIELEARPVFAGGTSRSPASTGTPAGPPGSSTPPPRASTCARSRCTRTDGCSSPRASRPCWCARTLGPQRPARLTVFRVRHDGRLNLLRAYDVDTRAGTQFWCGMIAY